MNFKEMLLAKAEQVKIALTSEQLQQFAVYYQMLVETNEKMNLTAITQPEQVAVKHFIDSLTVYDSDYFAPGSLVCDVGSGAGFPGLPLKIYQPALHITLLDSLAKRLKFLQQVIAELQLAKITTCHIRAEDAGLNKQHRDRYDVVIARAVAPLNILAEYCLPLVRVGGIFAAMKAKQSEQEVQLAQNALKILGGQIKEIKEVKLPDLEDSRVIIYIKKEKHTPRLYPRKAGVPAKNPL